MSAVPATSERPGGLGNHGGLPLHRGYIFTPSVPFERAYVGAIPCGRPTLAGTGACPYRGIMFPMIVARWCPFVGATPRGRLPLLPLTGPFITRWQCVQNEALRVFPVKFPLLGVIKDILLYLHQFIDIADNPFVIIPLP